MTRVTGWAFVSPPRPPLPDGWMASGPFFRDESGGEWFFVLEGQGLYLHAAGSEIEDAADRALEIVNADDPAREATAGESQ